MLTVIIVMILTGIAGGIVNIALNRPDKFEWRDWLWSIIAGIGASFLIPLFLKTVDSQLLENILSDTKNPDDILVYTAFCLLAAISSKAFIQTLSDKVLKEAKKAREKAEQAEDKVREAEETAEQAASAAQIALDSAEYGVGMDTKKESLENKIFPDIGRGNADNDPWFGQFGGKSKANNRILDAVIKPMVNSYYCSVKLIVKSTDQERYPLTEKVQFYLHDSFKNYKPIVPVIDGKAELNLAAWGAFTVGAIADNGDTLLELDLSEHPQAQEPWSLR